MNNKEIGQYLRQKRNERTLTQAQLAQEFGVTYQAVSRWETGESIPDIETLILIADYYNISVDDILQHTTRESHLKGEDTTSIKHTNTMKILFAIVVFSNVLGIGLGLAFASESGTMWQILAILCFVFFVLGSHVSFNVFFFTISQRTGDEIAWYQHTYRTFFGILVFTAAIMNFIVMVYGLILLSLFLLIIVYCLLQILFGVVDRMHNNETTFLHYYKQRFFVIKTVLLLFAIGFFALAFFTGYRIVELSYIINIILIALALL
jgi:transcriptional regulator with XRE-family HTH domain